MTPFERSAQRLVTARREARACGQNAKAIIEFCSQAFDTEQWSPRCRQLDRKCDAIESATDVDHDRQSAFGQHERRSRGLRTRHEQRHRASVPRDIKRYVSRQGQGVEAINLLTLQTQRLLAGREDRDRGCFAPQRGNDLGDSVKQVLAVIENEQHFAAAQGCREVDCLRLGA